MLGEPGPEAFRCGAGERAAPVTVLVMDTRPKADAPEVDGSGVARIDNERGRNMRTPKPISSGAHSPAHYRSPQREVARSTCQSEPVVYHATGRRLPGLE